MTRPLPPSTPRPRPSTRMEARSIAAIVAGAVCIGFGPIWVRWSEAGPVATAFHRLFFALPFLAVWAARERPDPESSFPRRSAAAWSFSAGLLFALDMAAWHLSIRHTSVANATLLANFAPIFVTLGAWIFLRERTTNRFFLGMALSLAGAGLLTGASLRSNPDRWHGDLLGLTTAVFYGGYQLCVARLRRVLPPGRVLLASSLVCTPFLWIFAAALGETIWPVTARGWGVSLGLALTAQVLGQGLITYGFAHLSASYSSLTLLVQPLVAAAAGWLLLGEQLLPAQAAGAGLLLAGLITARRGGIQAHHAKP